MLARLRAAQLIANAGVECKLIGTIHDSIVADCPMESVTAVASSLHRAVADVPDYCRRIWGYDFSLPLTSELSFGPTKYSQERLDL